MVEQATKKGLVVYSFIVNPQTNDIIDCKEYLRGVEQG